MYACGRNRNGCEACVPEAAWTSFSYINRDTLSGMRMKEGLSDYSRIRVCEYL
jgi:hypothetical protein